MLLPDLINTAGVSLILLAFLLLQMKKVTAGQKSYLLINIVGAGLACYGSFLIKAWPFVVLEGVWVIVAVFGMLRKPTN
ncbi:MAG: hypothetical protein FD123_4401 [Bacteroidetes bacterium]|nr:MAG: hypothetical protein FD123_4401 [Bacteroidota bacterium]